jgi:hypothetical protein
MANNASNEFESLSDLEEKKSDNLMTTVRRMPLAAVASCGVVAALGYGVHKMIKAEGGKQNLAMQARY